MEKSSDSYSPFTWPTIATDYKLQKRIGNGAFSSVWKAVCTSNTVDVAIKIMDLELITTSFEDILQEVQTMRLCDNSNVLRCFCSFVQKDQLWLITELMDKGSCLRVMNVARHFGFGEGMNEEWLAYILREALQGLRYLHDNGQIHRDIKSGNILLDSRGNVRIADFGVSGWMVARGQRQETVKTFVGTPCWMAPEVMEQLEGYDHRADIWSIGITALELAKGMAPYAKYPPMRVLVLTIEEEPPSLKTYENDRQRTGAPFSRMYEDFVKKCLQKNPKSRLSADELLKHKFFKGRSKDALLHQLLDHLSPVGSGEEYDRDEGESSIGSSAASFFRDAGSIGSKNSSNAADLDMQSVESGTVPIPMSSPVIHHHQPSSGVSCSPSRSTSRVSFGHSLDESKLSENNSVSSSNVEKEFVSGTTWVFDSSLGESGVYSTGDDSTGGGDNGKKSVNKDGSKGKKHAKNRRLVEEEDDDVGEFLDGFDRETASMKTCACENVVQDQPVNHDDKEGNTNEQLGISNSKNYVMPSEGSAVLDCGSIVSSLNSLGTDDIVTGLLGGNGGVGGQGIDGRENNPLLGAAKQSIFEFDDRDRIKSDELIAAAGGFKPGPLLRSMDDKMVSSLTENDALERLIGSGLYKKNSSPNTSATLSNRTRSNVRTKDEEDDDEDIDVFLDGFEEETADMNF